MIENWFFCIVFCQELRQSSTAQISAPCSNSKVTRWSSGNGFIFMPNALEEECTQSWLVNLSHVMIFFRGVFFYVSLQKVLRSSEIQETKEDDLTWYHFPSTLLIGICGTELYRFKFEEFIFDRPTSDLSKHYCPPGDFYYIRGNHEQNHSVYEIKMLKNACRFLEGSLCSLKKKQ